MPIILLLAAAAGFYSLAQKHKESQAIIQRLSAYRHPALAPAIIQSPEFYASLSARYNRPFLGK